MARASKRLRNNAGTSRAQVKSDPDDNNEDSVGVAVRDVLDLTATSPPPSKRRSKRKGPVKPKPSAIDRLSPLSAELIALILQQLSMGDTVDLASLRAVSLTNKALLPHARQEMYRALKIGTRVTAHSLHRTLHGRSELNKAVRRITADVGTMAKTSSQWSGWFLFHSMHSLCGIIGSSRNILTLDLFLPEGATAWTQSLCQSLVDLKFLQTINKDIEPSGGANGRGAGAKEGMDVGFKPRKSTSMWSVSQLIKPLMTLKALHTLRLCGLASDSSTTSPTFPHSCKLTEVVLIGVDVTNTDLTQLLGNAKTLKKFTLWRSSLLSKRGLTNLLKKCPNLVELRIGGSWFGAKDEDDNNFPLDNALQFLPQLRLLHVSGALISPAVFTNPVTNLSELLVNHSPAFTPAAVHAALSRMPSDPVPVRKLTLPEMALRPTWNDKWMFSIRATCEAKGVKLVEESKAAARKRSRFDDGSSDEE